MPSAPLTVRDVRERYAVSEHTVLTWIRSGELRAIDVAPKIGGRPRWRITGNALIDFERMRTSGPPAPKTPRKKQATGAIQFYK